MRFEISQVMNQDQVMDVVYGNSCNPKKILGRHFLQSGQVISAYHPDAVTMEIITSRGERYTMDPVERQPVFSVFIPVRRAFSYQIKMGFKDGNTYTSEDPYSFDSVISQADLLAFREGIWPEAYRKLGCHPTTINGVKGVFFAVWAPSARRVSVVGDFNFWNGLIYPMERLGDSGIFELFIPRIDSGQFYKFEIKDYQGTIYQTQDPFAVMSERHKDGASRIFNVKNFEWEDSRWMSRRGRDNERQLLSICEIFLPAFKFPEEKTQEIVQSTGHTHIMIANGKSPRTRSHSGSDDGGFINPKGFFEAFYRDNTPDRMRNAINQYHAHQVGVLLEITPEFLQDGLSHFCQHDHSLRDDPLFMENSITFCHRRREMFNVVLSNLLFWIREYHVDGFAFRGFSRDLDRLSDKYISLPPGKEDPGISERLLLMGILEDLAKEVRRLAPGIIFIADEPGYREYRSEHFDYLWNNAVWQALNIFLSSDESSRDANYYMLSMPLMRADFQRTVLGLNGSSPENRVKMNIDRSGQDDYDKLAESKLSYGYMMGIPGRKAWTLDKEESPFSRRYISSLLDLYRKYPALYDFDLVRAPFYFVNATDVQTKVLSFLRMSSSRRDNLIFICNFSDRAREDFPVGVPRAGIYRKISDSDAEEFGGSGTYGMGSVEAELRSHDLRPYTIRVSIAPRSVQIFRF